MRDGWLSFLILCHLFAKRKADITIRTKAVDALNRSLLTEFLPVHLGRGLGLYALNNIPSARKFVMRQGLGAR